MLESVLEKLKRDLKDNKKGATKFINDCFGEMLHGKGFIGWLANGTGYKTNQLKQILKENQPNKRNSKFTSTTYQDIYNFWLENCISSNKSTYNMKRISKRDFLEQYSSINDSNLIKKQILLKMAARLFSCLQDWFILSMFKICNQVSMKNIHQFRCCCSLDTNPTIASDQLKKKS